MNRPNQFSPALASALLAIIVMATLLLPSNATSDESLPADPGPVSVQPITELTDGQRAVAGEVLVGYSDSEMPTTVAIPETADPQAAAKQIEQQSGVSYAIPNYIATTSGWNPGLGWSPNDPGRGIGKNGRPGNWKNRQWNFLPCLSLCHPNLSSSKPQSRGGMNVTRAWQHLRKAGRAGASGVKVAVLDTGIAYRNLGNRFRRSPDLGKNRFLPGYDFVERDRVPLDLNGHGTHVASTIGQQTNNGRGLTGIAYRAKLMPVRVMDPNGDGTTRDIVAGIRWATRQGADVIVMSLNFGCGVKVPPLTKALRNAWRKGVVLVGSSGNRGNEDCSSLPATDSRVISVGGTTESGCVATYTFPSRKIDIAAPGGGRDQAPCPFKSRNRSIFQITLIARVPDWFGIEGNWIGTSMSAAHIGGAAAAVIASGIVGRKRAPKKVRNRLIKTARMPAHLANRPNSGIGAGIVNLGRAVNPKIKTG